MVRFIFVSSFFCSLIFANEEPPLISANNSKKGNISISVSSSLGPQLFFKKSGTDFRATLSGLVSSSVYYYLTDSFSIGLDTSLYISSITQTPYILLGPSIQYTIWRNNRISIYSTLSFLAEIHSPIKNNLLRGDIGFDYYPNPYISFGPYLRATKFLSDNTLNVDYYTGGKPFASLGGRFSVHF